MYAYVFTMVIVAGEIFGVDEEVMVSVQLPEFTINYIEVFIREIICDLINVILLLQQGQSLYIYTHTHTFILVSIIILME